MEITITTSDPHEVSIDEIRDVLEDAGYLVGSITVSDREGRLDAAATYF